VFLPSFFAPFWKLGFDGPDDAAILVLDWHVKAGRCLSGGNYFFDRPHSLR
jgi:hypothetical protein